MPKYHVCAQRYVEETTVFYVEADDGEDAAQIAHLRLKSGEAFEWTAGDDIICREVYCIFDEADDIAWERA